MSDYLAAQLSHSACQASFHRQREVYAQPPVPSHSFAAELTSSIHPLHVVACSFSFSSSFCVCVQGVPRSPAPPPLPPPKLASTPHTPNPPPNLKISALNHTAKLPQNRQLRTMSAPWLGPQSHQIHLQHPRVNFTVPVCIGRFPAPAPVPRCRFPAPVPEARWGLQGLRRRSHSGSFWSGCCHACCHVAQHTDSASHFFVELACVCLAALSRASAASFA